MAKKKILNEYMIDDRLVQADECTYQEFKTRYNITSDEYNDLDRGYAVTFTIYDDHPTFIRDYIFKEIAIRTSEYGE